MKRSPRSLTRKFLLILVLSMGLSSFLTTLLFTGSVTFKVYQDTQQQLQSFATIISQYSQADLLFQRSDSAKTRLSILQAKPEISQAAIYDADGELFANYISPLQRKYKTQSAQSFLEQRLAQFLPIHLEVIQPIMDEGEIIGHVKIYGDMSKNWLHLAKSLFIAIVGVVAIMALAIKLGMRLSSEVISPIKKLAEVANSVSKNQDYTVRVTHDTEDEIGTLIDNFNLMLTEIQNRDEALQRNRESLEDEIKERTVALTQANTEMLDDLKQGGMVQRGLMEVVANDDYLIDIVNHPYKGWVGGDGYSLLKSNNGDYWLRVSDGTGHGSSGGEAEIVDHLLFSTVIHQAQNAADALQMVTCILHERFPNANLTYAYFLAHLTVTGQVDYVNARQLAFQIKKHHIEQLPSIPVIVGEIGDIEIINHKTLQLEAGDSLLIATDGIFEARYWKEHRQKQTMVGKNALKVRAHLPVQDIYKEITSFPKFTQNDDILIVKLTKTDKSVNLIAALHLMRDMSQEELDALQNSEIISQSWCKTNRDFIYNEHDYSESHYFSDLGTEVRDFLRKPLDSHEVPKRLIRQTQGIVGELLHNAEKYMGTPFYLYFSVAFRTDGSILIILENSSSKDNFDRARTSVMQALDAKLAGKVKLDELADKLLQQANAGGMGLWNTITQLNGDFWVTFDSTKNHLISYCIIKEK